MRLSRHCEIGSIESVAGSRAMEEPAAAWSGLWPWPVESDDQDSGRHDARKSCAPAPPSGRQEAYLDLEFPGMNDASANILEGRGLRMIPSR